ncbi:MAG: hypothetical protein HYU41_01515 [Candidatus Rokubacteria bacterium]|nr:hypothetical protein [Candidatus Rokubacteria bacterium]
MRAAGWERFTFVAICRIGAIPPGATVRLDLDAPVHSTGSRYATAHVVSQTPDHAADNNRVQFHSVVRCPGCRK